MLFRNIASQKKMLLSVNPQVVTQERRKETVQTMKGALQHGWNALFCLCLHFSEPMPHFCAWRLHGRPAVPSVMKCLNSAVLAVNRSYGIMGQNFGLSRGKMSADTSSIRGDHTVLFQSASGKHRSPGRTGSFWFISSSLGILKLMVWIWLR